MLRKSFSLMLAFVFCCTTSGVAVLAQEKTFIKLPEVEKIRQKVLKRGTGVKARARVKLSNGTKLKGYISETGADDFTLVPTDEKRGAPVRINYRDVVEFTAHGKGMSTTSKVLIGTGIAVGVTVGVLALALRNFRRNIRW